jgi:hypothetical protein
MQQYGNSEIQVCVNNPIVLIEIYSDETDIPYDTINNIPYKLSTEPNDAIEPFTVDYDYCLPQDRKIRNFSTKRIDNIEVCYERVSKIELPMSYCSPDTNVNVQVSQIQL